MIPFLIAFGAVCASAGGAIVLAVLAVTGTLGRRPDPVRDFHCMRTTLRGGL